MASKPEGVIIQFPGVKPPKERVCSNCDHASFSNYGIFCMQFMEMVDDPVAKECEEYEPN